MPSAGARGHPPEWRLPGHPPTWVIEPVRVKSRGRISFPPGVCANLAWLDKRTEVFVQLAPERGRACLFDWAKRDAPNAVVGELREAASDPYRREANALLAVQLRHQRIYLDSTLRTELPLGLIAHLAPIAIGSVGVIYLARCDERLELWGPEFLDEVMADAPDVPI